MKTGRRIYVKVQPRSSQSKVEKISEGEYKIRVFAPAEKGKANEEVCSLLAEYFGVPKSLIKIVGGKTASKKIIDIG